MELDLIARFHVRSDEEARAKSALAEVAVPTRAEAGCLDFRALQSLSDPGLFFIHSRWSDKAAFEAHADLSHTRRFIDVMEKLADQPAEIVRTTQISPSLA
ncbi:MAG TPA: putative quinol monooxygenase [Caulobacteraceae bacterium]